MHTMEEHTRKAINLIQKNIKKLNNLKDNDYHAITQLLSDYDHVSNPKKYSVNSVVATFRTHLFNHIFYVSNKSDMSFDVDNHFVSDLDTLNAKVGLSNSLGSDLKNEIDGMDFATVKSTTYKILFKLSQMKNNCDVYITNRNTVHYVNKSFAKRFMLKVISLLKMYN